MDNDFEPGSIHDPSAPPAPAPPAPADTRPADCSWMEEAWYDEASLEASVRDEVPARREFWRPPPPANHSRLGFELERALRAYRRLIRRQLEEYGLHPAQESLLTEILFAEGSPTLADYARRLGCSRKTVARSVQRLCRAGYLEVTEHPGDARLNVVRLTHFGEQHLRYSGSALRTVEDALERQLPRRVRTVLFNGLDWLADNLDALVPD